MTILVIITKFLSGRDWSGGERLQRAGEGNGKKLRSSAGTCSI
jgi:hypothetical protein